MEKETGETVFYGCYARRGGGPVHHIIKGLLAGTIMMSLLLGIADMGAVNQFAHRMLRGMIKARVA